MAATVRLIVNGKAIDAPEGISVGALLHARNGAVLRQTQHGAPRGLFCGMGVCFDCLVKVDGRPNVRACMTLARDGMIVEIPA
ncbi:(2Fe-2S)-binding protein [Kaistia adipata]|uniref:(2Fe-2S)-binding protein n=1 Tax=Kaistia adipata TaxID=166954 RepID=UPI0004292A31|nr:(2Fe-2S)-binding protein [Kaistia adipata]